MLTAHDIHDALPGAMATCELIARFLNQGRTADAGQILLEQATSVRDFKRTFGPNAAPQPQPAQIVSSVL